MGEIRAGVLSPHDVNAQYYGAQRYSWRMEDVIKKDGLEYMTLEVAPRDTTRLGTNTGCRAITMATNQYAALCTADRIRHAIVHQPSL